MSMTKYNFINLILVIIFLIITINLKKIDNKYFNEKIKDFVEKIFIKRFGLISIIKNLIIIG